MSICSINLQFTLTIVKIFMCLCFLKTRIFFSFNDNFIYFCKYLTNIYHYMNTHQCARGTKHKYERRESFTILCLKYTLQYIIKCKVQSF